MNPASSPSTVLDQITGYIRQAHRIAIVTHERPDADALGSSLGLAHILRQMGKEAIVYLLDSIPFGLNFLPGLDQIVAALPDPETDLVIAVDAGEPSQIGLPLYDAVRHLRVPLLVVDHHESNTGYGHLNIVFPQKASTAEVVLTLAQALDVPIDPSAATCLLAGIVFDTRAFATPDTRPETLRAAACLMERGGSLYEVMTAYRGQHPLKALRLWGEALTRMEVRDGIAWTSISREMYRATGTTMEDTEGLANFILDAADVRISLVFRERPEGGMIRISARAKPGINLVPLARSFPTGGGHKMAVGFEANPPLEEAVRTTIACLEELRRSGQLDDGQPEWTAS
ncbi:MAG: bifunctional oligoribonuclease/PAP phosphatase NrnA [Anaerolineae bacterium]|nr:bifunctional oligoribonuclease/PAP phosphatase NrnA [Anaerolineae bacterium]MDW8069471.1 bifunctional oligoribonuclease/PAP phosphatase NrnA [Anaerolineae bacterium]